MPSFIKTPRERYVNYEKIIAFISANQTSKAQERHIAILEKLTRIYREGIDIKDWPSAAKVIEIFGHKIVNGDTTFLEPLKSLLVVLQYHIHLYIDHTSLLKILHLISNILECSLIIHIL